MTIAVPAKYKHHPDDAPVEFPEWMQDKHHDDAPVEFPEWLKEET